MTTSDLHDRAMELAGLGDVARVTDPDRARGYYCEALALERQAAEAEATQPSRGILLRSAAWLALDAGDAPEALRLARLGLEDSGTSERLRNELQAAAAAARERL